MVVRVDSRLLRPRERARERFEGQDGGSVGLDSPPTSGEARGEGDRPLAWRHTEAGGLGRSCRYDNSCRVQPDLFPFGNVTLDIGCFF